jgi:hypothetical protein
MIHIRLTRILQEQYATNQAIQTIADPETILITSALEIATHLTLCIEFRFQVIETIAAGNEEVLLTNCA